MREADGGINGPPNAKRPPGGGRKVRLTKDSAWQGQKDLNPRPSVLETDALPTELYPSEAGVGLAAKGAPCKTVVSMAVCRSDTRSLSGERRWISVPPPAAQRGRAKGEFP